MIPPLIPPDFSTPEKPNVSKASEKIARDALRKVIGIREFRRIIIQFELDEAKGRIIDICV